MTEKGRHRLSPAQVGQLAALLDEQGVRTLHLDTVRGRLAIELAPCDGQLDGVAASEDVATVIVSAMTVGEFLTIHPCRSKPMARCSEPQSSAPGIAIIGGSCPESLQRF